MTHSNSNARWIIGLAVLVVVLALITIFAPQKAWSPRHERDAQTEETQNDSAATMQQSDEPEAIQTDIDTRLMTDFQF